MKKMMTLTICAVVALSITACASSGAAAKTPITEATAITETTAITKSTTPTNTSPDTMIANPFVDCQTMETAAEVAGFEFRSPEQVEGISEKKIQAVDQEMIQVIYSADENQILIRKAPGTRNISGDYNNYQKEETLSPKLASELLQQVKLLSVFLPRLDGFLSQYFPFREIASPLRKKHPHLP